MRDIKPIIGYVHTGIEKTAEQKSYWKVIPVVERMDYLSYYFNAMAYCGAVETLLGVEVPARAQYLRVIHLELNRIMSHLVWLGTQRWTSARSRVLVVLLPRARRRSSTCSRCPPASACTRATSRSAASSRTSRAAGSREGARILQGDAHARRPVRRRCWTSNEIVLQRLRNVGAVDEETLLGLGVTGPLLRAAGNPWDLRKAHAVLLLRRLRLQDPGRHDRRQLRSLPRALRRDLRVGEDHRAGARRPARGAVHHRGPQGRAAAAPRAGDLDGGAHPPLQAGDRGLPRAAGRGLLPDRVAARRARLLRALRRLVQARARAHARPLVRQPPGDRADGRATPTSPT